MTLFISDGGAYAIIMLIAGLYYGAMGLAAAASAGAISIGLGIAGSLWVSILAIELTPQKWRHWLIFPNLALLTCIGIALVYLSATVSFISTSDLPNMHSKSKASRQPHLYFSVLDL